ncbi:hypothetical protein GCM10010116_31730 [Microbispora rosea subsp. aerata]|nr:hypothetical protein [Microbispora rosea]GGO15772.1 hypothetical protein GCM10010116_31730 [Microbispora rosea subsp. aerata]GIH58685.1 hypothetical protein Mro02_55990 [Microbispora rosea subsp. aerata]GLJ86946.1 hypothetical protein GCM10017588_56890 [Microbispora rosea subsp. aerata]
MHRIAITALALTTAAATASLTATPASAAAKPNLRACYDGKCTITITKPVSFRVASRYHLSKVRVARVYNRYYDRYMVHVSGPGVSVTLGEGARGSLNSLSVRVLSITGKGAKVRFLG